MQKAIQILSVLLILHFAAVTQSIVSLSQSNVAILQLSEANTKSCYPLPQSFTALQQVALLLPFSKNASPLFCSATKCCGIATIKQGNATKNSCTKTCNRAMPTTMAAMGKLFTILLQNYFAVIQSHFASLQNHFASAYSLLVNKSINAVTIDIIEFYCHSPPVSNVKY